VLVHDRPAEDKFLAEGFAKTRYDVMYNDFVLIGPASDPAAVKGRDIVAALTRLAGATAPFVSRGDNSGTHAAELRLWKLAGEVPETLPKQKWYRDIGGGMGQALNAASAIDAYTLADRGTWLSFNNKGSLVIAVEHDPRLINRYDVVELSPQKHGGAKLAVAHAFANWLVSPEGQAAIGAYQVNGQRLFNPSAGRER
jgi:tungstate transport system substrate-binding protein